MTDTPTPVGEIEAVRPAILDEIEKGLDGVTPGPWQVVVNEHPWHVPQRSYDDEIFEAQDGAHVERRIFTTWEHPQAHAPFPVVNISTGIGTKPGESVHMVWLEEADAAHIARQSPGNWRTILDYIASLNATVASLTAERDEARTIAKSTSTAIVALTPGGSEYFTYNRVLDQYFADTEACQRFVRERNANGHAARIDLVDSRREIERLKEALRPCAERLQLFLDTFGDVGDCETDADLNDWRAALASRTLQGSKP